jgi:phosphate binding protein
MRSKLMVLLLVAAFVLAACGGRESAEPTATPLPEPTAAPAAEPTATAMPEPTAAPAVEPTATAMPEPTAAPAAETAPGVLPAVDPLAVSGDIITAGSSTVFPLTEAMAERFTDEGYAGNLTIDSIGTGAGFERFCKAGETDISNASRAIKDSEIESCRAIGREPVEFRVGTDALAVVVNPANDWIGEEGLTVAEVAKLFSSEVTNWSEVNPAWPAEPIKRFSPGTDSGTFDYFIEAVMNPAYVLSDADEGKGEEQLLGAANLQLSEDDNVLVQGVAGDKNAIGYFGYAYYTENEGKVRDLAIEGVAPAADVVEAGEYALARPLFIYSDAKIMAEKPQVAAFINFYLTNVNEEIDAVGYFPASAAALNLARQNWLDAMGQ